jgi:hypothetical protein
VQLLDLIGGEEENGFYREDLKYAVLPRFCGGAIPNWILPFFP